MTHPARRHLVSISGSRLRGSTAACRRQAGVPRTRILMGRHHRHPTNLCNIPSWSVVAMNFCAAAPALLLSASIVRFVVLSCRGLRGSAIGCAEHLQQISNSKMSVDSSLSTVCSFVVSFDGIDMMPCSVCVRRFVGHCSPPNGSAEENGNPTRQWQAPVIKLKNMAVRPREAQPGRGNGNWHRAAEVLA